LETKIKIKLWLCLLDKPPFLEFPQVLARGNSKQKNHIVNWQFFLIWLSQSNYPYYTFFCKFVIQWHLLKPFQHLSKLIMNLQVLHDSDGNNSGVYIPAQEWNLIKKQYPDIEEVTAELPAWQKEILSSRIEAIAQNPEKVKPIKGLFDTLDKKVKK
jgi:hypothetical protein